MDEQFDRLTDLKLREGDKVQTYFNTVMGKTYKLEVSKLQKIAIFKWGLPKYIKKYITQERLLENLKKAKETK